MVLTVFNGFNGFDGIQYLHDTHWAEPLLKIILYSCILTYYIIVKYTVGELKDLTNHRAYGVKLPHLRAVWAGQWWIFPLVKLVHFS